MGLNQEKAEVCHQEMEAKMDGKQEKMDNGLEETKAQVGPSLPRSMSSKKR
jgi:hypothetical protein